MFKNSLFNDLKLIKSLNNIIYYNKIWYIITIYYNINQILIIYANNIILYCQYDASLFYKYDA